MTIFLILAPFAAFALLMLVDVRRDQPVRRRRRRGRHHRIRSLARPLGQDAGGRRRDHVQLARRYISLIDGDWSATEVRLAVDIGTLAIALASIAIRAPFTLQYAREAVDAETMKMPSFMRVNYIITWAWTGAFVLMLIANVLMIYMPSLPFWVGLGIGLAARNSAVYFTKWYPASTARAEVSPLPPAR